VLFILDIFSEGVVMVKTARVLTMLYVLFISKEYVGSTGTKEFQIFFLLPI